MTWYSTGTVTTSANNTVVTGTGTAWNNSGLRPGDMLLIGYSTISPRGFEIKSVDSATQITLVLPFPVAVSGAGYVGIPMLSGDRTSITMTLASQVTKALADTEAMSAVYQTFYTSPGTVSLTLPGGLVITGSSFQKLTADMASKADASALDTKANLVNGAVPINQGGTGANTAATAWNALAQYGTTASTAARGDDVRLSTIEGKSGGAVTGNIYAKTISNSTGVSGGDITSVVQNTVGAANTQFKMFAQLGSGGQRYGFLRCFQDAAYKDWYFDYSSGNAYAATSWQNSCDVRIKDLITRVSNPLVRMRKIKGCTWVRKDDQMKGAIGIGLIAQDVLDAFSDIPEVVSHSRQGSLTVDGVEVEDPLAISPGDVSAALHHEAILALMDKIEALEEKVASLEKGTMG